MQPLTGSMDANEKVIFAELDRDHFDHTVEAVKRHFGDVQYGSQGDDWIWIERTGVKIEIDSFHSHELEIKAPRDGYAIVQELLKFMKPEWIKTVFAGPKVDLTQ